MIIVNKEALAKVLYMKRLTWTDYAKGINRNLSRVSKVVNGKARISADFIVDSEQFLKLSCAKSHEIFLSKRGQ